MFQLSVLLVTVLFAQSHAIDDQSDPSKTKSPYDLADEVRARLDDALEIVRGHTFSAMTEVDNAVREVFWFRDDSINLASIEIRQGHEQNQQQLTTLKELAQDINQNIDQCLEVDEPLFNQLPQNIIDSMLECLVFANVEVTVINNDARYRIDIYINELHIFSYYIDLCEADILCLSPLYERIELAEAEIPIKIDREVLDAKDLLEELKVSIDYCTADKVAQYAAEAGILIGRITTCVNGLLS